MAKELTWKSAKILPRFYDNMALSLIGQGACRTIASFKMGYGYVDESTSPPTLLDIPDDLTEIPNVFYEGTPENMFASGRILSMCYMPDGAAAEPVKYSLTGLYDNMGDLIAVCIDLPDWITPSDRHTTYTYVDFPNLGDNPPQAFEDVA